MHVLDSIDLRQGDQIVRVKVDPACGERYLQQFNKRRDHKPEVLTL